MRTLFVTVGSTKFDNLIKSIEKDQRGLEKLIKTFFIEKIVIQHGRSRGPKLKGLEGDDVEILDYLTPERMSNLIQSATVIMSHGGAGTIFEVLRSNSRNLESFIVVENDNLMDKHQSELIDTLIKELNCPIQRGNLDNLFDCCNKMDELRNFKLPEPNMKPLINSILSD